MSSYDSRFERELRKRINEEIERLTGNLVMGSAITDYAKYQNNIGRIAALTQVANDFCPEVQTIIDKG